MNDHLVQQVKRHEGFRSKPYLCTAGKTTIGFGRNLDDVGITEGEASFLLRNDLSHAYRDLITNHSWADELTAPRKEAFINMVFNLGINRFNQFKKMLAAAEREQWDECAVQALDSRWAKQVGKRAVEIAEQLRTGSYVG